MGKSATGKDTIYKELLKNEALGLRAMVPYTTRPIRAGETEGVEYRFTDEETYKQLASENRVIESRIYDTVHGLWRYFTVADAHMELERYNYCMIGTLEAYVNIREYFGESRVLPVLIELDDGERLERAIARERSQEEPRYEEMCRRFLADNADFSEERIARAGITRRFRNNALESCLEEVAEYIREHI